MGRKEMGILRRAELEGLRLAIALSAFRSPCVCEKNWNLGAPAEWVGKRPGPYCSETRLLSMPPGSKTFITFQ